MRPTRLFGCGDRSAPRRDWSSTTPSPSSGRAAPSSYGLRVAEELGRLLAAAGLVVVSGMARGIDAAAHRGALAGDGITLAVLGGGADVVYPASERRLYRDILRRGAVISEAPPGQRPERGAFPETQQDHGGPRGDHRGGRGRGALRLADHRPPGTGAQSTGGRGSRPGHLQRVRGDERPARRRRRRRSAVLRTCSTGCSALGLRRPGAPGLRWTRSWRASPMRCRSDRAPAMRWRSRRASPPATRRWPWRASSSWATSRPTRPVATCARRCSHPTPALALVTSHDWRESGGMRHFLANAAPECPLTRLEA